jgi:hypothetical protein
LAGAAGCRLSTCIRRTRGIVVQQQKEPVMGLGKQAKDKAKEIKGKAEELTGKLKGKGERAKRAAK